MKRFCLLAVHAAAIALLVTAVGCEAPALPTPPQVAEAEPVEPAPPAEPVAQDGGVTPLPEDETLVTDIPRKFDSHDPIKGRRSRRVGGYLGATAGAKFYAEFQMMINNLDHANQLYWAEKGDWPKTQEDFMKNIVEFNQIKLPEIPLDEEYCYVPSQGEVGLQIRLKPGSPRSKVPAGTSPEDAIRMLAGGEQPAEQAAEQPAAEEPSPDIRTRAGQLGEQGNKKIEERGLAPGGLVPVGGLE